MPPSPNARLIVEGTEWTNSVFVGQWYCVVWCAVWRRRWPVLVQRVFRALGSWQWSSSWVRSVCHLTTSPTSSQSTGSCTYRGPQSQSVDKSWDIGVAKTGWKLGYVIAACSCSSNCGWLIYCQGLYQSQMLSLPRRLWFHLGLFVRLSVCYKQEYP